REGPVERHERQMAMLRRLGELGMGIAEDQGRRSAAAADDATGVDVGVSFARVARALRTVFVLENKFEEAFEARQAHRDGEAKAAQAQDKLVKVLRRKYHIYGILDLTVNEPSEERKDECREALWERLCDEAE